VSSLPSSPPWGTFGGELAGLEGERRFALAERLLLDAERQVRLLDRVAPLNFHAERARLRGCLERGHPARPRFEYAAAPDFSALSRALAEAARLLGESGPLGELYAARAEELELEAALASAIGSTEFSTLASRRFPAPRSALADDVDRLARAWLAEGEASPSLELVRADDTTRPDSLLGVLRGYIGELRLPIRIECRADLATVAAAGDGFVVLRRDAELTPPEARRIAQHELFAHVLPRFSARRERVGVFRTGTRGSNDEEEGRALVIEERGGFLAAGRPRELALRHLAALAARELAPFPEIVERLEREGASRERALDFALRATRGGGLGREVVYLPAYLRVRMAFAESPARERYFERGRVTLAALDTLSRYASSSSTSTGA
jgi:hypothetical protein